MNRVFMFLCYIVCTIWEGLCEVKDTTIFYIVGIYKTGVLIKEIIRRIFIAEANCESLFGIGVFHGNVLGSHTGNKYCRLFPNRNVPEYLKTRPEMMLMDDDEELPEIN